MPAEGEFRLARAGARLMEDLPDLYDPTEFLRLCSVS